MSGGEVNHTSVDLSSGLESEKLYIHVILEIFMVVPAILGNLLILLSIKKFPSLRSRNNILIANLAFADLLVGSLLIPFNIFDMLWKELSAEDLLCYMELSLFTCFLAASVFNNFLISLERFCIICCSLWYARKFKRKLLYILVAMMWFLALGVSVLPYFGFQRQLSFQTSCSIDYVFKTEYISILSAVIVSTIVVTFLLYGFVIKAALSQLAKTMSSAVNRKIRKYAKRTWLMMFIFIVFVICWGPYVVLVTLAVFKTASSCLMEIRQWTKLIGLFNSGVNWIIYGLMNTRFRVAFKCILTCQWHVNFSRLSATDSVINPTIRKSTMIRKSTFRRGSTHRKLRMSRRSDLSKLLTGTKPSSV